MSDERDRLETELLEAEKKAWQSLARYKFQMFGYWAAIWVHMNRVGRFKRPSPFAPLVKYAKNDSFQMLNEKQRSAFEGMQNIHVWVSEILAGGCADWRLKSIKDECEKHL